MTAPNLNSYMLEMTEEILASALTMDGTIGQYKL